MSTLRERAEQDSVASSEAHRRVQFQNAVGEFFNPHLRPTRKINQMLSLRSKPGIIAPTLGHGKHFCENMQFSLSALNLRNVGAVVDP